MADQLVFSGLTREQADATKQFHEDNGAAAEIIPDGPTLFSVLVTYPASAPTDNPTSAFVQNIVGIANRQWDFFGDQTFDLAGRTTLAGHKEGEDGWYQRVGEYWLEGTPWPAQDYLERSRNKPDCSNKPAHREVLPVPPGGSFLPPMCCPVREGRMRHECSRRIHPDARRKSED